MRKPVAITVTIEVVVLKHHCSLAAEEQALVGKGCLVKAVELVVKGLALTVEVVVMMVVVTEAAAAVL